MPVYGDELCVASVSVKWPQGDVRAWVGDNGAACDAYWYPSGIIVSDDNHETACVWVNKDEI